MLQIINPLFALTVTSVILIYILYKKVKTKQALIFILLVLCFMGINISEIFILNFVYPGVFVRMMYSLVVISIAFFLHFILLFIDTSYSKKLEVQALIYIIPIVLTGLIWFSDKIIYDVRVLYDPKIGTYPAIYLYSTGFLFLFIYSFLYTVDGASLLLLEQRKEKFLWRKRQIKTVFLGTIPFAVAYSITFGLLKLFTQQFNYDQLILIDSITNIAVIVTYVIFSFVVIVKVFVIVPVREVVSEEELVAKIARCGIDCKKCKSFVDGTCLGCEETNKGEKVCEIYKCASKEKLESCVDCKKFEDCQTFTENIYKRSGKRFERLAVGATYIIKEKSAKEGYELFKTLVFHGAKGYCISRTHPLKIRNKYKLRVTPISWLSVTPDPDSNIFTINPTNLASMVATIKDFLGEAKEEGIVLIDGVDYLIGQNSLEAVAKIILSLNELVVINHSRMIITLNPRGIDDKIMKTLEREMNVIDKMPNSKGTKEGETHG